MQTRKIYPDWVEKHHTKGTTIKQIGDNYYLYSATSKYNKDKGYATSIQRYIGRITKEDGLIKAETISFMPSRDKISLLKDCFDLSKLPTKNRKNLFYYQYFLLMVFIILAKYLVR